MRFALFSIAVLTTSLCACGGSIDSSAFEEDTADGASPDGAGPDGGGPDGVAFDGGSEAGTPDLGSGEGGPDTSISPDAVPSDGGVDVADPDIYARLCADLTAAICTPEMGRCCERRLGSWEPTKCAAAIGSYCGGLVADARAGRRTINLDAAAACEAGWRTLGAGCSIPALEWVKAYAPCNQLFLGTVPPGSACRNDTDCAAPVGTVVSCSSTTKKCETVTVVKKDDFCSYDTTNTKVCDKGFYCPFVGDPGALKCKTAKAIGDTCDNINDPQCGYGNSCKDRKCQKGLPQGASCRFDLECASWSCGADFKCTDSFIQIASPAICVGAP